MSKIKISKNTLYAILVALSVTILLVSNLASVKLFDFFGTGLVWDGGAILFPLSYILGDVIAEIYGFRRAKKIIWVTLAMNILAVLALYVVQLLPPGEGWQHQASYEAILGFLPRLVIASLLAYAVGQVLNAFIFVKIKTATAGRKLWLRALGSSLVGDLIDSAIFVILAFGGVIAGYQLAGLIVIAYLSKMLGETVLLPMTYAAVRFIKKSVVEEDFTK
jgi:uncharacterized integral membrane protein (TIGR00697 family)